MDRSDDGIGLDLMHSGHGSGVFSVRGPALLGMADWRAPIAILHQDWD